MRLIHITDFHLNTITRKDWLSFIKDAFNNKLIEINSEKKISLVAFTGDLIDKGGENFNSAKEGFQIFNDEIIESILNNLELTRDEFFFSPGNHDVSIPDDDETQMAEFGAKELFKNREKVSSFISKNKKIDTEFAVVLERIKPFKEFEFDFYKNSSLEKFQTKFSSSFLIEDKISRKKIGITCINSAWRCFGKTDKGNLIIGDDHIMEHVKFIDSTEIKICLIHHPLDMLSVVEQRTVSSLIQKHFDVLLFGHYHESDTNVRTGYTGTLFQNMAPSGMNDVTSNDRRYSNGFTIIDIESDKIVSQNWRYNNDKFEFVINTDLGDDYGKFEYFIPKLENQKIINEIDTCLDHIKDVHFPQMNEHVIEIKTSTGQAKSIKEHYILPPITSSLKTDQEKENNTSLNEIVRSTWNSIFFGNHEAGKTIFLYRLVNEFVDEYVNIQKIPVYIDFEIIGNKDFKTIIKEYLNCKTYQVNYLLEQKKLVLLIDNLNYSKYNLNVDRFNKLNKFLSENKEILLIACSESAINGIEPFDFVEKCQIPFQRFFIKNLGVKEIKSVMKLWVPSVEKLDLDTRINKLISNFQSFSLPSTAMSVSLFLWSTEFHEKPPINQSVLLEIYMDIILQKLDKSNIYRENFDFENKLQTLAKIAYEMLEGKNDDYSITYSEYLSVLEKYFGNEVGFDFDAEKIGNYFIERKIIKKINNKVKFTYSCYFHFFLAKRMQYNKDFKTFVFDESEYCKFTQEIDLYTGLVRSDEEILDLINTRFENEFKRTDFIFDGMKNRWDKHFMITPKKKDDSKSVFEPIAKNISLEQILKSRPSEELIEDLNDRRLQSIPDPSTILRKNGSVNFESLLILQANTLRNSEGVENKKLKKTAYNNLVKYSLIWTVLYREYLIDYVIRFQKLPPTIPIEYDLISVLKNLPLHVQSGMYKHAGSSKLAPIILDKINEDNLGRSTTKSDIEHFMSVALYSDVQGKDFPKYFKKMIRNLNNNPVQDYTFYKLLYYYHTRTRKGSENEQLYLDLISELRYKNQSITTKVKEMLLSSLNKSRDKFIGD